MLRLGKMTLDVPLVPQRPLQLVGTTKSITTGLSRYTRHLHQALQRIGANIELVGTKRPPIPDVISRVCKSLGFDLNTFFTTYPISLPAMAKDPPSASSGDGCGTEKEGLMHLTSQNQASALAFARHRVGESVTLYRSWSVCMC